ncbi:MAG: hypothetical protein QNI95_09830 [Desulfobacterales bacterium]|nr:hypothetical protein [Desulfobacterales bacterium]
MTHKDAGKYAAKHPRNTPLRSDLEEMINHYQSNGKIACAAAFQIVQDLNLAPSEVGQAIDLLETRIEKCQLGLFGYTPQKKKVVPAANIAPELESEISASVSRERITCFQAWAIAEKLALKKMDVAAACEKLNIKISACQLGAF